MKYSLSLQYKLLLSLIALSFWFSLSAQMPPKPLWVIKGVENLNKDRISTYYEFVAFHHELTDRAMVPDNELTLLRENMAEYFKVSPEVISIDSVADPSFARTTYRVTFPTPGKDEYTTVIVQPVDSYKRYDDNIDGSYDYKLDELYAISEKDVTPSFDNFEVTRKYNAMPAAMSLIPGVGQIYKGQRAKGYSILGAEIVFCGAIAFGEINRAYYMRQARKNPGNYDSWKSKANGYKVVRNVGIVFAAATYIYNIFDAAFAKGAPHVVISRGNSTPAELVIAPEAFPGHFGAALSFTF